MCRLRNSPARSDQGAIDEKPPSLQLVRNRTNDGTEMPKRGIISPGYLKFTDRKPVPRGTVQGGGHGMSSQVFPYRLTAAALFCRELSLTEAGRPNTERFSVPTL